MTTIRAFFSNFRKNAGETNPPTSDTLTSDTLLFLVYINDLQGAFSKSIIHHFEDETIFLFPAKKLDTIESVVSHDLKLLSQWLESKKRNSK